MSQVNPVLLKKFGKYEVAKLNIPKCMILGSLKDAIVMHRGGKVFKYLMDQRMKDVEETYKDQEHLRQFQKACDKLEQGKF